MKNICLCVVVTLVLFAQSAVAAVETAWTIEGEHGSCAGSSLEDIDITGNGYNLLLVGAPCAGAGTVEVRTSDGSLITRVQGPSDLNNFGLEIRAGIGDVDADGYNDFLVSGLDASQRGAVVVVSGLKVLQSSGTCDSCLVDSCGTLYGEATGNGFGFELAVIPGSPHEVAIAAPGAAFGQGAVEGFRFGDNCTHFNRANRLWKFSGEAFITERCGEAIVVGNVFPEGSGLNPALVVGCPNAPAPSNPFVTGLGRVAIITAEDRQNAGAIQASYSITSVRATEGVEEDSEHFGKSLHVSSFGSGGDANQKLIVGAPLGAGYSWAGGIPHCPNAGRVYAFEYTAPGGFERSQLNPGASDFFKAGYLPASNFGFAIDSTWINAVHTNQDGEPGLYPEEIIFFGIPNMEVGSEGAGRVQGDGFALVDGERRIARYRVWSSLGVFSNDGSFETPYKEVQYGQTILATQVSDPDVPGVARQGIVVAGPATYATETPPSTALHFLDDADQVDLNNPIGSQCAKQVCGGGVKVSGGVLSIRGNTVDGALQVGCSVKVTISGVAAAEDIFENSVWLMTGGDGYTTCDGEPCTGDEPGWVAFEPDADAATCKDYTAATTSTRYLASYSIQEGLFAGILPSGGSGDVGQSQVVQAFYRVNPNDCGPVWVASNAVNYALNPVNESNCLD